MRIKKRKRATNKVVIVTSDSVKADKAIELLRFNVNITLFIIIKFLILENKCKKCV